MSSVHLFKKCWSRSPHTYNTCLRFSHGSLIVGKLQCTKTTIFSVWSEILLKGLRKKKTAAINSCFSRRGLDLADILRIMALVKEMNKIGKCAVVTALLSGVLD